VTRRQLLVLLGLCEFRNRLRAEAKQDPFIRLTESDLVLETRLETLGRRWITANEDFFVLSRYPVEVSNEERLNWQLTIAGEVNRPVELGIEELRNARVFPRSEIYAFLQCAGYGRRFFDPPFKVSPWGAGAIGNALWAGIRLADVLERAQLRSTVKHIAFAGKDCLAIDPPYIKSLPLEKAVHPDTLLVFWMNGSELPVAHGGPLRLLVPGWAGTYSMKWLQRIEARSTPWNGYWMSVAYQHPVSVPTLGSAAQERSVQTVPITATLVNSMITRPLPDSRAPAGNSVIEGFAWSGRAEVDRVEVSTDGGHTWRLARLQTPNYRFAWKRWQIDWNARLGVHNLVARARDRSGAIQPLERTRWNSGGYEWQTAPSIYVIVV